MATHDRQVKALHLPPDQNPYQRLLFDGLQAHGVECDLHRGQLSELLAPAIIRHNDVLHVHWLHRYFAGQSLLRGTARGTLLLLVLAYWRLRGRRVIWTVHNLSHHEGERGRFDQALSTAVAHLAHVVISHSAAGRVEVADRFRVRPSKVIVGLHGNYCPVVDPTPVDPSGDAGARILFFGQIRPYKGVEGLLKAFEQLQGEHRLRVAGQVREDELQQTLDRAASRDQRIELDLRFLPDEDLLEHLRWSSIVVLPFTRSFSSGSLLFALSAGRGVLLPDITYLRDYLDDEATVTYPLAEEDGLLRALTEAARRDHVAMGVAAQRHAERFDWVRVSAVVADAYRGSPERRSLFTRTGR